MKKLQLIELLNAPKFRFILVDVAAVTYASSKRHLYCSAAACSPVK